MKKLLIVNNNMKVGGVQKSLYNLPWSIDTEKEYDVTLLLFSKTGPWAEDLPESVKVIECGGPFRYLGKHQGEFRGSLKDTLVRGAFAAICRLFGRTAALRLMLTAQPRLNESYDHALAYLHNGRKSSFYGGVQDYVLSCVKAQRKTAFIHCDYRSGGVDNPDNTRLLESFDTVAACSDGCRRAFLSVQPTMKDKCVTVRNFHRFDVIRQMADEDPIAYDGSDVNVIVVARLTHEKGIERAIKAVSVAVSKELGVKLHIVGGGPLEGSLRETAANLGIEDRVTFYGEQSNPYRYMKNGDLLLLTSYHEAAPMVIDEARCLGLPVLTVETVSSKEMVTDEKCGEVCENSDSALTEALCRIVCDREALAELKRELLTRLADNTKAERELRDLLEGTYQTSSQQEYNS